MKKYFIKDSAGQQQGPFTLDELKGKGITADTAVREEGLDNWTTAGQVADLKSLLNPPAVVPAPTADVIPEKPAVVATASAPTQPKPQPAVKAPRKKGSSAVTYALSLLVIAGLGYFIYQDMEKNKTASGEIVMADTTSNNANATDNNAGPTTTTDPAVTTTDPAPDTAAVTTTTTEPTTTTTTTTTTATTDPAATKKAEEDKKKAAAKKAADDKKKADALKKAEEAKKQLAAQLARETEMRNNWPRYITIGTLNFKEDDGIKAFPISVNNGMSASLDKVTIRVDYVKKEGKITSTEMLTLNNIPARGTQSVQSKGDKKAKKVNVYIVNATSRQLHFCYPVNSGNASDPYYCK